MAWELVSVYERNRETPYTFYVPSSLVIESLAIGDLVKLIFVSDDEHDDYSGERMWVELTQITDEGFKGILTNQPIYISDLNLGDEIDFSADHICDTLLEDPEVPKWDYYFDKKVVVTTDVLERRLFNFIMRDTPRDDIDTGWTFFTGYESEDANGDSDNFQVVSLGAVLNMDDSIIDLLDDEPLCAYERNIKNNKFYKVHDYDWDSYLGESKS
ncbi:DUF2185 domain-containing protein [Paenibacillus sp. sptzw28]|uniref:immunity protein Imm33 domain-containing protein n=1 Tax=Paenibacillus sp. sptzw28 TaxID=715179 RepID=UPI001C6E3929|nr:DUF2185 domain-containing protein [Paenibacillus sp. sptzw28]QYR24157.1 DUF2185 domain-containing protein [Paenibacillus sp. sptzw28]